MPSRDLDTRTNVSEQARISQNPNPCPFHSLHRIFFGPPLFKVSFRSRKGIAFRVAGMYQPCQWCAALIIHCIDICSSFQQNLHNVQWTVFSSIWEGYHEIQCLAHFVGDNKRGWCSPPWQRNEGEISWNNLVDWRPFATEVTNMTFRQTQPDLYWEIFPWFFSGGRILGLYLHCQVCFSWSLQLVGLERIECKRI